MQPLGVTSLGVRADSLDFRPGISDRKEMAYKRQPGNSKTTVLRGHQEPVSYGPFGAGTMGAFIGFWGYSTINTIGTRRELIPLQLFRLLWVVVKIMISLGYPKCEVPYYIRDPKRDYNFDNHPYITLNIRARITKGILIHGTNVKSPSFLGRSSLYRVDLVLFRV